MIKTLMDTDFILHYGITSTAIYSVEHNVATASFDIDDKMPNPIVPYGQGQLSLHSTVGSMDVFEYEKFIDSCKRPVSFANGRKRCDYVITSSTGKTLVCLTEITSATGSVHGLQLPIKDKNGNVVYSGGKYEKVENQLSESLNTLCAVPSLGSVLASYSRRLCLMAYRIYPYTNIVERLRHPFLRYLGIESKETKDQGAIISNPSIEARGFEYRRIEHTYTFNV